MTRTLPPRFREDGDVQTLTDEAGCDEAGLGVTFIVGDHRRVPSKARDRNEIDTVVGASLGVVPLIHRPLEMYAQSGLTVKRSTREDILIASGDSRARTSIWKAESSRVPRRGERM